MKRLFATFIFCFVFFTSSLAFASSGHYASGSEGLKAATAPPPGFYWRMYNLNYTANNTRDNNGKKISPDFNVNVFAMANRFIWSSEITFLGANLLMDVVIPTVYTDISMRKAGSASFSDNDWGLGDILVEPFLLAWHGDYYDAILGAGLYFPTGYYDEDRPASPGKGFWTTLLTLGGTVYFDKEKTWHASVLTRYEIHTKQEGTRQTHGNDFSFEWGVGKTVFKNIDVGVAGYSLWQVTDDSGPGASQYKEEKHAIGPEISFPLSDLGVDVSIRSLWEFESKNTSQGNVTTLTLTYRF